MKTRGLDWLEEGNPQLFRELKGRWRWRSLFLVALLAVGGQSVLVQLLLPEAGLTAVFQALNWLIPLLLLIPGAWLLMADLEQEERRGTLNFIRLSPQTSQIVLLGKLLGAPILLYFGVALVVPLHCVSAIAAQVPLSFLISFYGLLGVACTLVFSLALLAAFVSQTFVEAKNSVGSTGANLAIALLVGFGFLPIYMAWNQGTVWQPFLQHLSDPIDFMDLQWFFLPISENSAIAHGFILANAGLAIYWVWHILNRCFYMPTGALLSKRHSYCMTAHVQLFMLGFLLQDSFWLTTTSDWLGVLLVLSLVNLVWFGVLTVLLSSRRQSLLDWTRYRHMTRTTSGQQRSLQQELIWGEKSPALVAIMLNLVIAAGSLAIPVLLVPTAELQFQAIAGLLLSFTLLAIYAAIAQFATLAKSRQQTLQVTTAIGGVALLPPLLLVLIAQGAPNPAKELMLFSPLLWLVLEEVPKTAIAMSLLGQWGLLGLLSFRFSQKLKQLGASETKALLAARGTALGATLGPDERSQLTDL
jgi:hypothetical protein